MNTHFRNVPYTNGIIKTDELDIFINGNKVVDTTIDMSCY